MSVNPGLSIVVPVYNEQECVGPLIDEILAATADFPALEILLVDDGSSDETPRILANYSGRFPALRVLTFEKNAGQSAAMACGFMNARFDHVVAMDGDGQSDPADIPQIASLLHEFPLVCGYRAKRKDTIWKRWGSLWANSVRRKVTGDQVIDIGCSLKGFHREPLQRLYFFDGSHRFLPVLMEMEGCHMTQIEVHHRPRSGGTSKYGNLDRLARTWQDLLGMRWMQSRRISYRIKGRD